MKVSTRFVLFIIVLAQFCCTSVWFAGNGIIGDLISIFHLPDVALGQLTSAVQFGFIVGTLIFAIFTIADRFSPSIVFFICALLAAGSNANILWEGNTYSSLLILRFLTGFFLAGIYPVGMKIASDYFDKGLGKSLGFLVGALVLGTALPHLLKGLSFNLNWEFVLITTSSLSLIGGSIMFLFVPNGPHRKPSQKVNLSAFFSVFSQADFRASAFGYFGHMWELYAFWAFVPVMLGSYLQVYSNNSFSIPLTSFAIIGIGGIACVISGYVSEKIGLKQTAQLSLILSGLCCLLSPLIFLIPNSSIVIGFFLFWGIVVIADSPLFSTLVSKNALPEKKGTALTIVNCIGFSITIVSIQLLSYVFKATSSQFLFMILAIGPILGLVALRKPSQSSQN